MIVSFVWGFVGKNEIIWVLTSFLSAMLAFQSFAVQTWIYQYNILGYYEAVLITNSYIWLAGVNILFFVLSLILGIYDLYEKLQSNSKMIDMRNGQ
jgi:hypothetical protein